MTDGSAATTDAAIRPFQVIFMKFIYESARPGGKVLTVSEVDKVYANKYSFHEVINTKIPVAITPGPIIGRITLKREPVLVAPSIYAASSSSFGIVSK